MKSSIMNKTILAVAVLAMAAFAGVMVVGEDTDAAEETAITKVVYKIGDYSFEYPVADGSFVVKDISDFSIEYKGTFKNWMAGTVIYLPGQTVSTDGLLAADGKYILTASIDQNAYFYIEGADAPICIDAVMDAEGKISCKFPSSGDKAKAIFEAQADPEGYTFIGWSCGEKMYKVVKVEPEETASAETEGSVTVTYKLVEIKASGTADVADILGMNFTEVNQKNYVVTWVVDGTQISQTGTSIEEAPSAPVKANYDFAGWCDDAGVIIIKYSADADPKYSFADPGYKYTDDTTLYAKFVPVNMTVTFMVGDFSSTQTVLYGEKAMEPALPEGYEAWVDEEGAAFDFNQPIVANCTVYAKEAAPVEPATVYNVTFKIADKAPVTQKSDSVVVPNTDREGYAFQGWVVEGGSSDFVTLDDAYFDALTSDVTLVAVYKEVAPPAPAEPKFYETSAGQCAIVLAVFLLGFIGYMIYAGKIEVPKFKISRVGKEDAPVVKNEEEPKP